jgi:hypothetical protein
MGSCLAKESTRMVFEALALLCTALFSGAATYITVVEHPARLACGTPIALAQWRSGYRRAAVTQASLASLGLTSALLAFLQGRGLVVLLAGILLGAAIPFTLIAILPTTKQLLDSARAPESAQTDPLLRRWGHLHAVRTVASTIALVLLVVHALRQGG